ncbi:hypothetical protein TNCT_686321 [Trichonephila clavata]|uniref:Uncharacterized protein n=1 Tax=Trichonephila clavata TaxID=2740835 RepID=A0A8X6KAG8_TRICU|nr:hypothetical protein TNCT_686321 [Trichonephila clavata]
MVYSDSWKGHCTTKMEEAGLQHFKVNHRNADTQTTTAEQQCQNLSHLFAQARSKCNTMTYLKAEIELHEKFPIYQPAGLEQLKENLKNAEREHQALLGETTLITCPILTCKTHNPQKPNIKISNQGKTSQKK